MKKTCIRLAILTLGLGLLGAGCQLSQVDTTTGLPYWPTSQPAYRTTVADRPALMVAQPASVWRDAASRWVGTPYREGGRDRNGIDCSGFSDALYREVTGHGLPRSSREQWLVGHSVDVTQAQPGDLIFFQTTGEQVSHVAVSLGGTEFAHASTSKGVMISALTDTYWSQRVVGARRISP
jgi:cell wall-associated NlpC family hydrolase